MGENKVTSTYKLDGTESKNTMMGRGGTAVEAVSVAKWDGPALVIITKTDMGNGPQESTQKWSLAGSALTIEPTNARGTQKMVYKKQIEYRQFGSKKGRRILAGPFLFRAAASAAGAYRLSSLSNARSSSHTFSPVSGSRMSGAISASGPSTKKRSLKRGCGTSRPGSLTRLSPNRIRSRSSVRGAPGNGRVAAEVRLDLPGARRAGLARRGSVSPTSAAFR